MDAKEEFQDIGGLYVLINEAHRFGTDAVLLEDFAAALKKETVCEIGSGCGIIPFLMCKNDRAKKIYAVEIQDDAAKLIEKSIEKNGITKIQPLNLDAKDHKKLDEIIGNNTVDLVVCNPPYYKENSGGQYGREKRGTCREESSLTIYDVADAARRLLNHGGRLCVCYKPQRLCDLIDAMRKNGIEPKKLRFIHTDADKAPWLVLVEGKKGSSPFLDVLPPLVMRSDEGQRELNRIYGDTKNRM